MTSVRSTAAASSFTESEIYERVGEAVRSHGRRPLLPTPAPSRCPFNLMDVINNGRPLLTPTPGHRKSQASRSGSLSPAEV
ncbi:hypothetical protein Q8A67_022360 [Cirrhinus molitorella]|uniref:Uncharacterized protein n=1 Tax=Cirrhinus molitorella TaxID=172907 RepID=A0AA88TDE5_9TELE|nr:hypothetical protein Q8A67_022360 [Cirrhinus molitorella]